MNPRPADVSICIASYRRPEGLARLLASLARMKVPHGVRVETIVVDNDANASAAAVVRAAAAAGPLRYVVEPRRNIAHARNRALAEASGRWLAFIDDDEVADEGWLSAYLSFVEAEQCDGAFGPVLPQLERVVTPWIDPAVFYVRPRHPSGTPVALADVRTSNAILRRGVFEGRRFDPAFGRTGGSDSELFGRMLAAGARLAWCDEARVVEFVPATRHRLGWLAQRAFRGGCVHTRLTRAGGVSSLGGVARASAAIAVLALVAPFVALAGRVPLARLWLRACTQAGHLWTLLGRSYEEYRP